MKIHRTHQLGVSAAAILASALFACAGSLQQARDAPSPSELGTLEVAHQRQGASLPVLSEAMRRPTSTHVSYRVCVDGQQGRTIDVQPLESTHGTDESLIPALRASAWQVSGLDGPACFLENMVSNPDGTWRTAPQPYLLATSERLQQAGDAVPELPASVQQQFVGKSVIGLYRICLPKDSGTVSNVTPVVTIPGADDNIAAVLRTWHYKPSGSPLCWVEPLLFTISASPEKPAPAPSSALPRSANTNVMNNVLK